MRRYGAGNDSPPSSLSRAFVNDIVSRPAMLVAIVIAPFFWPAATISDKLSAVCIQNNVRIFMSVSKKLYRFRIFNRSCADQNWLTFSWRLWRFLATASNLAFTVRYTASALSVDHVSAVCGDSESYSACRWIRLFLLSVLAVPVIPASFRTDGSSSGT